MELPIASRRRKTHWLLGTLLMLFVLVAAGLGAAYWQKQSELAQLKAKPADEATRLLVAVGTHMLLPSEKPTIATVEDTKKLQNQSFFKSAHNGDKILLYAGSKKAILYRPSIDKIVEVAYLNLKGK